MQSRYYRLPSPQTVRIEPLLEELHQFFLLQGHQVQVLSLPEGHILQAQKESTFSTLTGQSTALTVRVQREPEGLRVEVGNSKWLDKAAVGLVGWALLPPLILLPVIGAINQFKLSEDVWEKIENFIARSNAYPYTAPSDVYGAPPATPFTETRTPPQAATRKCGECGTELAANAQFCSRCGARAGSRSVTEPVTSYSPTCPQCGLMNQTSARFCSGCGHQFGR